MKLLLSNTAIGLCHQHQFLPWEIIFFDCLGDNPLRIPIGIDVCCIPLSQSKISFRSQALERETNSGDSSIISRLQQRKGSVRSYNPACPLRVSNAHTSDNRNRYAKAAVSEKSIVHFRLCQRLCNAYWKRCHDQLLLGP